MNESLHTLPVESGNFVGEISKHAQDAGLLPHLARLPELLATGNGEVLSEGRNRNVRLQIKEGGQTFDLVVKQFGRQSFVKDLVDRVQGSKARRTWRTACRLCERGVGTPRPVAFLERRSYGRLVESYCVTDYMAGARSFKDELIRLFREDPECAKFMALLQTVADAVRGLHEAGVQHNDLGNQNILLGQAAADGRVAVGFIDLNRATLRTAAMTERQRARDLSRIYLPSDLLRVFKEMYWNGVVPPRGFQRWESLYRGLYAWHCRTRALRHPLRERRLRAESKVERYPAEKDMWIWDERSGQAICALRTRERNKLQPLSRHLRMARVTLGSLRTVWPEYRKLQAECFRSPVEMKDRIGVAIDPKPGTASAELGWLRNLARVPVLIRFYHHEPQAQREFRAGVVRQLHSEGFPVSVALVQDRAAVLDEAKWRSFVFGTLERIGDCVRWVEVGHAINRVKWGLWDCSEHARLMKVAAEAARKFPALRMTGPAVIDFEYPFVLTALRNLEPGFRLSALSHHLYVDRRGPPEACQGSFSSLDKFALARAIARTSAAVEDRLIVSEVNWPLAGTGVYSPVGSPYESPGPRTSDPSVSEDQYADYMLRYLLLALCSGMVDQVFWWRLAARGYGLVDDSNPGRWRPRPAYRMLQTFVEQVGSRTFIERLSVPAVPAGNDCAAEFYLFKGAAGDRRAVAYIPGGERDVALPFACEEGRDAFGFPLEISGSTVRLSGRPLYLTVKG